MTAALIRWELICIPIEASCIGLAVWLTLGTPFTTLGTMALFGVCVASLGVRFHHYLNVKS